MKQAQIIGIAVAAGAGILAMLGVQSYMDRPAEQIVKTRTVDATRVLVARRDISLGEITTEASFRWQEWPRNAVTPAFITADRNPRAHKEMSGSVARSPILGGEPVTSTKLIQAGKGGVLAAILPPGKRAVSTQITERSAVGKLILPNDHVDVILTQRKRSRSGGEEFVSDTLFRNIRVLAIGRQIEAKEGKTGADGNVATLELSPRQAEMLALANMMGDISLSLRSVADITTIDSSTGDALKKDEPQTSSAINITRYGASSRVYGVN